MVHTHVRGAPGLHACSRPLLSCRLMSWVKPGGDLGIHVGQNALDDLDYAEDGALLLSTRASTAALPQRFDEEAGHLCIPISQAKTKIQNNCCDVDTHRSPSAQTPSNRSANLSTLAARSLVMNTACLESALHHLKRDIGGMRLWKSWYLTMDKDRWREFAIRAFAAQAPKRDIEIARHSASKMALTCVLFYCTVFAFIQYYWIV